jgi:predicted transcriptional regulator with HTH domain
MSSGQHKRHDGFNKSIIRNGLVVILRKDGSIKVRLDPKTKEVVKDKK